MSNKLIVKSELTINAPVERVWKVLSVPERLARLFSPSAKAVFSEQRGRLTGNMTLGELTFELTMTRYDLLLSAPSCTIVLRLSENAQGGCNAAMASACSPDSGFLVRERDLFNVLSRLRSVTAYPTVNQAAAGAAQPVAKPETSPSAAHQKSAAHSAAQHSAKRSTHAARKLRTAAIALGLCAVILLGVFTLPGLFSANRHSESVIQSAAGASDLSAMVNYQTAVSLSLGSTRHDAQQAFGTKGIHLDGERYLYRSEALTGTGQPAEQVCVEYKDGAASRITYLNLSVSSAVAQLPNKYPAITATDLNGIVEQAGAPLSMFRRAAGDTGEQLEVHFGYLDPFANFDPAWRGELAVYADPAAGTVTMDYCQGYDGSDPLVVGSLENTLLANQFDSYTVYLQDKYQYDKALLLTREFSRGDVERIYGALNEYDAGSGVKAYSAACTEMLEDGATPAYQYTFGFEDNGAFRLAAFVNMRLMNRENMLNGTRWQSVTRNMSYGEVRALLGILPTAVYVNDNSLILGYGRYLGGAVTEQQFELVVRFRLDTLYADVVYKNAAESQAESSSEE